MGLSPRDWWQWPLAALAQILERQEAGPLACCRSKHPGMLGCPVQLLATACVSTIPKVVTMLICVSHHV